MKGTTENPILLSELTAKQIPKVGAVYVMRNKDRAVFKVWRDGGFICEGRAWYGPIRTSPPQPSFSGLVSTIKDA